MQVAEAFPDAQVAMHILEVPYSHCDLTSMEECLTPRYVIPRLCNRAPLYSFQYASSKCQLDLLYYTACLHFSAEERPVGKIMMMSRTYIKLELTQEKGRQ